MRIPTSLRALYAVTLAGLLSLAPATAGAAPAAGEDRPFLVRLWEFVERFVGAEEGGPGIDPLGLVGGGEPEATEPCLRARCPATGSDRSPCGFGEDVCK
jgi:hypothetical protein